VERGVEAARRDSQPRGLGAAVASSTMASEADGAAGGETLASSGSRSAVQGSYSSSSSSTAPSSANASKRKREDETKDGPETKHLANEKKKVKTIGEEEIANGVDAKRVAYFNFDELSVYGLAREHAFRPFRAKLTHVLLDAVGVLEQLDDIGSPLLVTRTDLGQFHTDTYIQILVEAQKQANKVQSGNKGHRDEESPEMRKKVDEVFLPYNLYRDQRETPHAIFPGIFDYCRLYTSGTLGCAAKLCLKEAIVAVNWYGGMMHARSMRAQGGCYVNDTVLGILEILKVFEKVLFINLSGFHCDAVEEAFYTTDRVMTVSFHLDPDCELVKWPRSGKIADIGTDGGEFCAVNVPLQPGSADKHVVPLFQTIVKKCLENYQPKAVVMQCGGALLSTERGGFFNMTEGGYGKCLKLLIDAELPMLVLGGNGSSLARTAQLWAYLTDVLVEKDPKQRSIPKDMPYEDYFYIDALAPESEGRTDQVISEDKLEFVKEEVLANLGRFGRPASVKKEKHKIEDSNHLK